MKRNVAALIVGLLLVLAGIGYVGAEFFDWNFNLFFDGWWTLFIIVPAFVSLLSNGARTSNIIVMIIGFVLLLRAQNLIPSRYIWLIVVGVSLIGVGVSLITSFFRKPNINNGGYYTYDGQQSPPIYAQATATDQGGAQAGTQGNTQGAASGQKTYQDGNNQNQGYTYAYTAPKQENWSYDQSNYPNYSAFLSGVTMKNVSQNFEGARISVVMGGADIDLRDVIINKDITIYVSAIMGGVDIYAPKNVRVAISKTDILGGTDCRAQSMPPDTNVPVCNFVCTSIMAGIDIK